ncbi:putative uncharacterized protein [Parachlamydia acanthamoebae UV-7]|uniref:PPM-type phosphatase domain-containing protein n=2 Tax=Parachlamydia acanthamoebae TaxID=83552 RepID=F8KZU1_PARAV|nr:protein phosphatase 2C domain-containing protein [Parachlamydia acanthamoebae]CCB86450.1 putative uncharacterized protein [Parachlamydia acanthamoebae UV-7]
MTSKIDPPKIMFGNKELTVKQVESCVGGNLLGRTVNRIILGITKQVWINDQKVANKLKILDGDTLDKIYKATTNKIIKNLIFEQRTKVKMANLQGRKIAIIEKLDPSLRLFNHPAEYVKIVEHITRLADLPRGIVLAKHQDKLVWVRKDQEGWKVIPPLMEPQSVKEDELEFVDVDTVELEFLQKDFVLDLKGKKYPSPQNGRNNESLLKATKELKEKIAESGQGLQFKFSIGQGKSIATLDDALEASESGFVANKDERFVQALTHDKMNGMAILQAKGYLPEGEYCADWVALDNIGDMTIAIVADAAGNKKSSHDGSLELTNRFRQILTTQLVKLQKNGNLSSEDIGEALTQAIIRAELVTRSEGQMVGSTMACTIIIPSGEKRYAIGFGLGDARVMLKKEDGTAKDLTPTNFESPYSDPGPTFGAGIKKIVPIFQELRNGDTILLGSDGFGDNMEAKSLGKTPIQVLKELDLAGKLDNHPKLKAFAKNPEEWILQATSPSDWTFNTRRDDSEEAAKAREWQGSLSKESKALLQELHTLYSEHLLEEMDGADIADTIYTHCTKSPFIEASLFVLKMEESAKAKAADIDQRLKSLYQQEKDRILDELCIENLKKYKDFAIQLTDLDGKSEELTQLFKSWDEDPKLAHEWFSKDVRLSDKFKDRPGYEEAGQLKLQIDGMVNEKISPFSATLKAQQELEKAQVLDKLYRENLETYKDFAIQTTGLDKESEELTHLFASWDVIPEEAHLWLGYRAGKPDDFSLIAVTVK